MTQFKDLSFFHSACYVLVALGALQATLTRFNPPAKVVSASTSAVAENAVFTKKKEARQAYQKEMASCMSIRETDADASNTCRVQANTNAYKKGLIDRNTALSSNALDVANYPKRSFGMPTTATEVYFATEGKESSKLFWGKE